MKQLELTENQKNLFVQIKEFLSDATKEIFVFKGYAGTGKTTLITFLGNYLHENHWEYNVLAPTGRAAKVLRDKFAKAVQEYGYASCLADKGETIHSAIYSKKIKCKEVDNPDVAQKSFEFFFPLKANHSNGKSVLIIDESSMIGDTMVEQEFLKFGSGRLLSDILEFKRLSGVDKIIFVGDDAQLPPVSDPESRALDASYFSGCGYGVSEGRLTEVIRQDADSMILKNANAMRDLLQLPRNMRNAFQFEFGRDVRKVVGTDVAQQYTAENCSPGIGDSVFVAFTNRQCFNYNQAVRSLLYGDAEKVAFENNTIIKLRQDDMLLNTKNSRETWGQSIYNGDILKVLDVGSTVSRTVPVKIKDEPVKHHVRLSFTEAVLLDDSGNAFKAMLLDNCLYAAERDLTVYETRALYIDFCMRIKEKHPGIREGSDEYNDLLLKDIYFNSLQVKFGYAVTCHKAQGGEWENVWVDYSGRVGLSDDALRWCYTATTRARKTLMAICPPDITPYEKLVFSAIQKVDKAPKGFFSEHLRVDESGTEGVPVGISLKIRGIKEALSGTPFSLQSVKVMGYQLSMLFGHGAGIIQVDTFFYGEGVLRRFPVIGDGTAKDELHRIINDAIHVPEPLPYNPSNKIFAELYSKMQFACGEAGAKILNVSEEISKYYVLYSLKTDAIFATIQYFFGINLALTVAVPRSELGVEDAKLAEIIKNMQ